MQTPIHRDWEKIKVVLTKAEGELLYKHWGEDQSYADIAKEVGEKEATIRQQCNRAKQKVWSRYPELRGLY